jgi:hypothetical protein
MANKKKNSSPEKKAVKGAGNVILNETRSGKAPVEVEKAYLQTGRSLQDVEESQMFGKPCFKINGKAFMSLFDNCVVFKLTGDAHEKAMKLKGSKMFDPSGKGRAMKEWVEVTASNKSMYKELANSAMEYVKSLTE